MSSTSILGENWWDMLAESGIIVISTNIHHSRQLYCYIWLGVGKPGVITALGLPFRALMTVAERLWKGGGWSCHWIIIRSTGNGRWRVFWTPHYYTNRVVLRFMVIDYAVSTTKCRTMAKQRVRTSSKKLSQINTNQGSIRVQLVRISMFEWSDPVLSVTLNLAIKHRDNRET